MEKGRQLGREESSQACKEACERSPIERFFPLLQLRAFLCGMNLFKVAKEVPKLPSVFSGSRREGVSVCFSS